MPAKVCKPGTCTHIVPHGSSSTYTNHGCRCDDCKAVWSRYCAKRKAERYAEFAAGLVDVAHGRASTYANWGCRCRACTDAYSNDCYIRKILKKAM